VAAAAAAAATALEVPHPKLAHRARTYHQL
jgi:hypothetical protein